MNNGKCGGVKSNKSYVGISNSCCHAFHPIFVIIFLISISLRSVSGEIITLFAILFIFQMFAEMLTGFLFLSRRFNIRYLALFYLVIGTIVPFSIYRTVSFFLVSLLLIPYVSIILTRFSFDIIMGASNVIEIIVLLFLGIHWIKKEYVHDYSK